MTCDAQAYRTLLTRIVVLGWAIESLRQGEGRGPFAHPPWADEQVGGRQMLMPDGLQQALPHLVENSQVTKPHVAPTHALATRL